MKKLLFTMLSFAFIANQAFAANSVEKIRVGETKEKTRIVFQASKNDSISVKKVFQLNNPPRLVIDMQKTKFKLSASNINIAPQSRIQSIREGVFNSKTHRIVIDLKAGMKYKYFEIARTKTMGQRFVVDLLSTKNATYYTPKPQANVSSRGNEISIRKGDIKSLRKDNFVVMIDAGHGGVDPGAVGKISRRKSVYEKTITLSIAKKLQREINKYPNMTAYLTRSTDVFVPLRTRIKKATKKNADLFISIHADAHNSSKIRGGSVYILSENSSDKEAARLARIANRGDEVAGVILKNEARDIQSILIDLTQRESMNKSALLAQDVLKQMKNVVYVKHTKAKFAGFVVLKSADIPSILVESSYISNPKDRAMLINPKKQDQLAKAIAKGTYNYLKKNY
ncbi:MAG: N-acetylmuramoyl-L-alanine amidase AmiC [Proteobacteria bacterium]|nr:MAG: N-acetylmuramoyl-L-alanine amidase AmiC [Pseudomonadota bacterium]